MNIPKELAEKMGIKSTKMLFESSKSVTIRYVEGNTVVLGNVRSIDIMEGPIGVTIDFTQKIEKGESSVSSAVKNIEEIVIRD